ncbi:resolvase [Pantoea wallisii]|uniref:resolvase n=1 Tax=Pantoea wallisii TaxID=1076551 RepID=UPI001FC91606|nr:resolvase [Pantoea wallisii]
MATVISDHLALKGFTREVMQISRSDVTGQNVTGSSAVALRNLAAAYGTDMPRYLLVPEVAMLLSKVPDPKKLLFIDALWNTGGRINEILLLTRKDFALDDPLTGATLSSPFVVLRTLKQRKLEEAARSRPTKEEQQAERETEAEIPRTPRAQCRSPIRASCSAYGSGLRRCSRQPARACGTLKARTPRAARFRRR